MNRTSMQIRSWAKGVPLAMVALSVLTAPLWAQTPTITRVEEDWEMVVGVPSTTSDAPQVTCVISPVGNLTSLHGAFVVNNHDMPTYTAGGLQQQVWNDTTLVGSHRTTNQAILATPGEVIRWTQVMQLEDGKLTFEVVGGTSTTWGNFGGGDSLEVMVDTTLTDLNGYSPDVSVEHSGVSYAANRVQSLVLKKVRVYNAAELVAEDTTPRVVHALAE